MKLAWVASAMILASVVLPTPGGPHRIMDAGIVALDLHPQGLAGTEQMLLANVFLQAFADACVRRAEPSGQPPSACLRRESG